MLDFQVARRQGEFELAAGFTVRDRTVTAVVGESGSGKTTLLRLLAGLTRPDAGRIVADGIAWADVQAGIFVPAAGRPVGYVPQDHALFPHLDVHDNVAFGLAATGVPDRVARARVGVMLERLGLGGLSRRRPHELSGGQQQRTALARALVLEPRLLLLDEPLAALDVQTRRAVRGQLRELLGTLACDTVYVTHSASEALTFGREIAVLERGRLTQLGSAEQLMRRPASAYVAEFLGVNFLRGAVGDRMAGGLLTVAVGGGRVLVPDANLAGAVTLIVRPRDISISREPPAGSPRNVFAGVVDELIPEPPAGELLRVSLATEPPLVAEVTREAADALGLGPGMRVFASFKATGVDVIPDTESATLAG